jgi:hypothetical protein
LHEHTFKQSYLIKKLTGNTIEPVVDKAMANAQIRAILWLKEWNKYKPNS